MGGGGSSWNPTGDVRKWVDKAKAELRSGEAGTRRNVFLSFAYEDVNTVNLLRGQAKNENLPLEFNDWSVSEPIDSERAPYIKQKILERIDRCSVTVVFLSDSTPKSRWVNWEIEQSIARGKHVLGVYPKDAAPSAMPKAIEKYNIKCIPWSGLADEIDSLQ